ncbi:MAG: prolipoprotein diacylglyceryl transferase family protein, partial [Opitutales bacterium]
MEQALAPGSFPIHDFSPFLIRFSGDFGIRYYGLAYVLGFVVALALVVRAVQTGRTPLRKAQIEPFFIALLLGVIVGGRLGSVLLYNLDGFLEAPWIVFFVWEGGMASHGGFIGVCAAVLLFAHREK